MDDCYVLEMNLHELLRSVLELLARCDGLTMPRPSPARVTSLFLAEVTSALCVESMESVEFATSERRFVVDVESSKVIEL